MHSFHLVVQRMLLSQIVTGLLEPGNIWCFISIHTEVNVFLVLLVLRWLVVLYFPRVILLGDSDIPVVLS